MNPVTMLDGKVDFRRFGPNGEHIDYIDLDLTGMGTSISLSDVLEQLDEKRVRITIEVMEESQ